MWPVLAATAACATASPPVLPVPTAPASGLVDMHVHTAPDVTPRKLDDVGLARRARDAGFRAVVLKNHHEPTASRAHLAMQQVRGIEIFGGIVLNRAVGGLNPSAIEAMAAMEGRRGRIVWLPTRDAAHQARLTNADPDAAIALVAGDEIVPALQPVLQTIARLGLVLATGHASPAEALVITKAARAAGVQHVLVTHALSWPVFATPDDLAALVAAGASIELVVPAQRPGSPAVDLAQRLDAIAAAFRQLGATAIVLSSDLGQPGNPLPDVGLNDLFRNLIDRGITRRDVDRAARTNPARVLGLETVTP